MTREFHGAFPSLRLGATGMNYFHQAVDPDGYTIIFSPDVRDEVPGEGYDAVIDTQTLGPNVARLGDALARIRAVLQPDGLFVSVPALGTAQEASVFLDALREAGFTLRRFEFTRFQDLGAQMAYPVIEADLSGGPGIGVDLEEIYTAMLLQLQSGV